MTISQQFRTVERVSFGYSSLQNLTMAASNKGHGSRRFYEFPGKVLKGPAAEDPEKLAQFINDQVIGSGETFISPFGIRRILYCDYIASGRSLKFIEDYIGKYVLPHYGNTHTTTTVTSTQTTLYRHEARDIIRNAVNASELDAVIFAGNGCTGAVHKLVSALDIADTNVTVFVSPQEHHSNLLPWRNLPKSTVIRVKETPDGQIDLNDLETQLQDSPSDQLLIGCFAAASNITGILNDDLAITALLHQYGGLSFWDYATAGPYVQINMNPRVPEDVDGLCAKDAIYFSAHKFVGGVQTPGILIAKKRLFKNTVPMCGGGGGSVFFVTEDDHVYLKDPEVREEAGTPAIVESIRAGMVMQLKEAVGPEFIMQKEKASMKKAMAKLKGKSENLILLGNGCNFPENHLAVISFVIKVGHRFLHHNYVCALLNDVFGIQARGGCACSGPYAQSLLGMSYELSKQYEELLLEDERLDRVHLRRGQAEYSQYEVLRPGFSRLNLPWFASDQDIDFVTDALLFVAEHGWKLMPQYIFNNETGEWRHHTHLTFKDRKWLGHISYREGFFDMLVKEEDHTTTEDLSHAGVMKKAQELIAEAPKAAHKRTVPDQTLLFEGESKELRWLMLPCEAKNLLLHSNQKEDKHQLPFIPKTFSTTQTYAGSGSFHSKDNLQVSAKYLAKMKFNPGKHQQQTNKPKEVEGITPKAQEITNSTPDGPVCTSGTCDFASEPRPKPVACDPQIKCKWHAPPKEIFKPFTEGVEDFEMIKNGDKVLVCLSGGKDSLSLLHTLHQYQFQARKNGIDFELGALTIDPLSSAYDPRPLIPYLAELNVPYLYEEQAIMKQALEVDCSSICSFCSRMKRGRMYHAARRDGWNVLAFGQHLDDLAESFVMSIFHNGRIRTIKACYDVAEGDLRIIRPFVYVRERALRDFAEGRNLPIIPENCPACFEDAKERHRVKQLLAHQELLFPNLYQSLKTAMRPAMSVRETGLENKLFGKAAFVVDDLD